MKYEMLCVYDLKAEAFLPPFCCGNTAVGCRTFNQCVADPSHPFAKAPEDYQLYHLGSFEDATAVIAMLIPPRLLSVDSGASLERYVPLKGVA